MKKIIAFFVSIWVFLFGKKVAEPVKVESKTLAEKMEEQYPKKYRPHQMIPQHNNRKRTRGRKFQTVPTGRVIYHC
jgi:hypothetical protein